MLLQGYIIEVDAKTGQQTLHNLIYTVERSRLDLTTTIAAFTKETNALESAYRTILTDASSHEQSWSNLAARRYYTIINDCLLAVNKCKLLKNGKVPKSSKISVSSNITTSGIVLIYSGKHKAYRFDIAKQQQTGAFTNVRIEGDDNTIINLVLNPDKTLYQQFNNVISQIKFVETNCQSRVITDVEASASEEDELMRRHVKTVDEISLVKDTSWLKSKQYFVVNNELDAEKIFRALETYNGLISYDVETTGLNMNQYCEIGSPLKKQLEEYNSNVTADLKIKADSLTGFSFCITPNVAYYFPCGHRKFKNLYEDKNEDITRKVCEAIKARYMVGDMHTVESYIATYIRETPIAEWPCDVVLMERVRNILEKLRILAHHGSFEYKVGLCYHIDTNLVEDTMILHQLAFKWKNIRTHAGEPSNLKYLSKALLGIDQLSLEDFFAGFVDAETAGEVRKVSMTAKKKKSGKLKILIDFSYMEYEGTRCYAPADVDMTLGIWRILKPEMMKEFPDLEYLYGIEIVLACAVGYAEFYGLHINEAKIDNAKYGSLIKMADFEHQFRDYNKMCSDEENEAYNKLKELESNDATHAELEEALNKLRSIIESKDNFNLGAPGQVGKLLYEKYNWKTDEDGKQSMGKKVIKQYEKLRDDDGNLLYPEVVWYRQWKDESTLITKFFDKLQDFMYPGGNLFTSFGQIACATGRMSSKKPNFQQMPGSITKIIEPRAGYVFFDGDFSQIEYRCLCSLAGETSLIEAFKDPDMDYHQKMASLMYDIAYALVPDSLRKSAKTFNFGIPYGMGFTSLAIQLHGNKNKASVDDAKEKYELYFKEQPKVRQFFMDVKEAAQYNEYTRTYFGRRRYFKFTDETGNVNQKFIASALRQAGNAVIQGTARDIFGIAAARAFTAIRQNGLLGKVRMVNFIHDEVLYEIDAKLNPISVVGMILECMQLKINGFPPLYVGGGIGNAWKTAKGSMNEIHPMLGERIIQMAKEGYMPTELDGTVESVYKYFEKLVYDFRKEKVAAYIASVEKELLNGIPFEAIDPAIGKLLGLQFEGGAEELNKAEIAEYKAKCAEKGIEPDSKIFEKLANKLVPLRLELFITQFFDDVVAELSKLGITILHPTLDQLNILNVLKTTYGVNTTEEEEDVAYDDDVEEDELDELSEYDFEVIDESNQMYGVSVIDIAKQFGLAVIPSRGVCCVYIGNKTKKQIEHLAELFDAHQCEPDDEGAMKVELVRDDNYVLRPDIYVNGLTSDIIVEQLAS